MKQIFLIPLATAVAIALYSGAAYGQSIAGQRIGGLPPLPKSATKTKNETASANCGAGYADGSMQSIRFYTTSADCTAWTKQVLEVYDARRQSGGESTGLAVVAQYKEEWKGLSHNSPVPDRTLCKLPDSVQGTEQITSYYQRMVNMFKTKYNETYVLYSQVKNDSRINNADKEKALAELYTIKEYYGKGMIYPLTECLEYARGTPNWTGYNGKYSVPTTIERVGTTTLIHNPDGSTTACNRSGDLTTCR